MLEEVLAGEDRIHAGEKAQRLRAVIHGLPPRGQTPAIGQADRRIKLWRPWKLLRFREIARLTAADCRDVFRGMNPEQILLGDGRWFDELHILRLPEPLRHEREFPHRHDVLADGRSVARMVKNLHRQSSNVCFIGWGERARLSRRPLGTPLERAADGPYRKRESENHRFHRAPAPAGALLRRRSPARVRGPPGGG